MERGARSEAEVDNYQGDDINLPLLVHAHNFNRDTESEIDVPIEPEDKDTSRWRALLASDHIS